METQTKKEKLQIAYLISAHTDAPQLKRLIEALQPDAEFFVHIDRKSNIETFAKLIQNCNVHFISERVDVRWGTLVEVEYQMNLIRAAIQYPKHFTHIFFLSGMDYPLWSANKINQWLMEHDGREFLQGICMDTTYINAKQKEMYTVARPIFKNNKISILARKLLRMTGYRKKRNFMFEGKSWKLYKGSAWWCISEELASHILQMYETKAQIKAYFKDSFCPAETLIQTIAFNTPQWAEKCILTEGEYPGLPALTPLHFIDYEPVIKILDEEDYDRLMLSGKMFCRKIISGKSDKLVKLIQQQKETQL